MLDYVGYDVFGVSLDTSIRNTAITGALYWANTCDSGEVSSTQNDRKVEPIGWRNPVGWHVDGVGVIYLFSLFGACKIQVGKDSVLFQPGDLIVLDDRKRHRTCGNGPSVALFLGPFPERCDETATKKMLKYVEKYSSNRR